jgi:putative selenium metabolism protein SsnA
MSRWLIHNGTVVTLEIPNRVLARHSILVEDDVIQGILPGKAAEKLELPSLDARGKIVMPGFINAHMHFYSSFARGLTHAAPSRNFAEVLRHLWWKLDRQLTLADCHSSTMVAGIEAIRHGTTTIIDHHASPCAVRGSLGSIARAVRELGLRACLCYEVSDRDGAKIAQQGIDENREFLEECRHHPDPHLAALFGLHASFTVGKRTLRRAAEVAREFGAGFHIHCAEDALDQEVTSRGYGCRVVDRLEQNGILGPKTLCAHGVHLEEEEWNALARTHTAVIHNPQSNMNNAVGTMDLLRAGKRGALLGLGTDAMTGSMLEELRSALWAQRQRQRHPGVAFEETVSLLIRNNQQIANRHFQRIGQIREGWMADIVCIDYDPPTEMNAANFAGHLVYGLSQATVNTTIVGGRVLMKDRQFISLDEEKINRRARKLSRALWERF